MIRSRRFRQLGAFVLVVAFALATCHVTWRAVQARRHTTIRFAHWQLESGIRDAFDAIARDYEARHPGLRVEQMLVPQRIYASWGTTQIVGGVAPDLVEIGLGMGGPEVYSYLRPITDETNQPNPYNVGTPLEGVAWRNTYANGMESSFHPETSECYGASVFASTTRIYFNVPLLREITGAEKPPKTFEELMALCGQVQAYADRTHRQVTAFAGSRTTAIILLDDYLRNQLQRLACETNPDSAFPPSSSVNGLHLYLAYLNGEWTLDHSGFQRAADLMRQVGRGMPPGYLQFARDDAMFYFAQGRALMMLAYSQDYTSVRRQVSFPVDVFRNPMPQPDAARTANSFGGNAEGTLNIYGVFGIPRASPNAELALDFLRFLTSRTEDEKFARLAGTLPVIVGVEPLGPMRPFMPDGHGFPPGPSLLYGNVGQAVAKSMYLLAGPDASDAAFLAALAQDLPGAMRTDIEKGRRGQMRSGALNDTTIEATRQLELAHAKVAGLARKYQWLVETQNEVEANGYFTEFRLHQAANRPPP